MELYSYPYRQKTFPYKHTKVFRSKICFNSVKRVRNRHFKIFYLKLRRQNRRHENCKSNVFHTAKLNLRVSLGKVIISNPEYLPDERFRFFHKVRLREITRNPLSKANLFLSLSLPQRSNASYHQSYKTLPC